MGKTGGEQVEKVFENKDNGWVKKYLSSDRTSAELRRIEVGITTVVYRTYFFVLNGYLKDSDVAGGAVRYDFWRFRCPDTRISAELWL